MSCSIVVEDWLRVPFIASYFDAMVRVETLVPIAVAGCSDFEDNFEGLGDLDPVAKVGITGGVDVVEGESLGSFRPLNLVGVSNGDPEVVCFLVVDFEEGSSEDNAAAFLVFLGIT